MKVLVVTSVFPNSKQPTFGVFVKERMLQVAKHCELKVVAPVPWFPFARYLKKGYRPRVPYLEIQDGIEVYHPRFFNIPKFFKFLDGFFFFLSSLITTYKLKKKFNFDIIDSHFVYPDGFGSILLGKVFGRPVFITVRRTIRILLKYPLIRHQIRYALNRAARVFSVCNDLKKVVLEFSIPDQKVIVVPNGINIRKFNAVDKLEARKELGLPANKKIIISVGWLNEEKGFHHIINGLSRIKETFPEILYVIIGGIPAGGNYEPVLRQLVSELGHLDDVFFAGPKPHDQLYKWLSASDLFCLATAREGWANVFLEAMACGVPVVTTRVGGNEEVVSSSDYGLLFNLGNEKEMIDAILFAFSKQWSKEAILAYAGMNTWDKRIGTLISQYKEVLALTATFPAGSRGMQ